MRRTACLTALLGLVSAVGGAPDPEKLLSVQDVMKKAHAGPNSLLQTVAKELKADDTDWDDVQEMAGELEKLGQALAKNAPPRGDKDSWARLTRSYVADARSLRAAAGKEDKRAARAAQARLEKSCQPCHAAHRPAPR